MPGPCRPNHVFREPLPGGLALHPFGYRHLDGHDDWLAGEEVLAHVDRLDAPAVYIDLSRWDHFGTCGIRAIVRLGKRVRDRCGRVVLCNVWPDVRDLFRITRLDAVPWLELRDGGMPGGKMPPPDPAWLSWGGGVVPALARTIAEGQDFALLGVLADALEEAGCTDAEILGHLRGPGPHVRGCWAVGLLLGEG